jgi:DNA primase catalytic core
MALYDRDTILASHRIEDVILAAGVELHPKGGYLIGCCPIHGESNPSMSVRPATGRYTCFSCGARGDAIQFVMDLRGVGFRQACDYLTNGHTPTIGDGQTLRAAPIAPLARDLGQTPVEVIARINAEAWAFYSDPARRSLALDYLATRGINIHALEETTGRAVVGHTGSDHWGLTRHLKRLGYTDPELIDSGWAGLSKNGVPYDRFKERLILPITDPTGLIRGIYGRATGPDVEKQYRHLNTKETRLFSKTNTIYRPSHHTPDDDATVVVCEGQLDALAIAARAAERGASHMFASVAIGTASISSRQTAIVSSLHPRPICIALDNDERGIKGALTVATAFLRAGREVIAASLPEGDDPASWLAKHPAGLEAFDRNDCLQARPGGNTPAPVGQLVVRAALRRYMEQVAAGPASAELARAKEAARDLIAQFGRDQPSRAARARYVEFASVELATNKLGTREAAARWLNRVLDPSVSPRDGVCPLDTPRAATSAAINA